LSFPLRLCALGLVETGGHEAYVLGQGLDLVLGRAGIGERGASAFRLLCGWEVSCACLILENLHAWLRILLAHRAGIRLLVRPEAQASGGCGLLAVGARLHLGALDEEILLCFVVIWLARSSLEHQGLMASRVSSGSLLCLCRMLVDFFPDLRCV